MQIPLGDAQRALAAYNSGVYKGRRNTNIDADAYLRFRSGLATERIALVEQLYFVGSDFGGAQARFLPHGIREESEMIAPAVARVTALINTYVRIAEPLQSALPDWTVISAFFGAFQGTRFWGVWASKTLHFLKPETFPILDSRAKKALGVPNLGSRFADYQRYCQLCADCLRTNAELLDVLRPIDHGSPSDLKLLDKLLYELGR